MLQVKDVTLRFGKRTLFEDVNLKFTNGNCYGIIGANGAGKSTFLKLLSGELETTAGEIILSKGERIATLKQDHFAYDDYTVMDTVIMGNARLYEIMKEKEELYSHTDFTEEDGLRLGELEGEFAELNGWEAESEASTLLSNLGLDLLKHSVLMSELPEKDKVKVLLAQALFGNPDILLLDEPTNGLDIPSKSQFRKLLASYATDERTIVISTHQVRDLESLLDHLIVMDGKKLLLNESVARITERLCFDEVRPGESIEQTLVAYPSLGGSQVVSLNTSRRETAFNLECFFNALLEHREQIMNALK